MVTFIREGGGSDVDWAGLREDAANGEAIKLTDDARKSWAQSSAPTARAWPTAVEPNSTGGPGRGPCRYPAVRRRDCSPTRAGLRLSIRGTSCFRKSAGLDASHGLTSTEDRRDARQIYLPAHERGMAHFSYLSPDRAWILLVEMGPTGSFERCRLVPFDGTSTGREVGPAGACHAAAWSPEQRWMYFSAVVDGHSHLWRQRFPNGVAEPLTSGGVTEEEGVAVAPDGQSLVTSIGVRRSSLWLHAPNGERLLSSEGFALRPTLSPDGKRLYYLLRRAAEAEVVELRVMDLATEKSDRVLPDFSVVDYAVSPDEREVAFTTRAAHLSPEVWVAALDRRTAPRRIAQAGDTVAFGADRTLVFRSIEGHVNVVTRIGIDGQNRVRISDVNVIDILGTSPDGHWVSLVGRFGGDRNGTMVLPIGGGEPRLLCGGRCTPAWSPDGSTFYRSTGVQSPGPILVVPLQPGRAFPDFPAGTSDAETAWRTLPGARMIQRLDSIPGLDPSTYVATKTEERRNLFRVPLSR